MKTITNSVLPQATPPQTANYRRILQSETPQDKPFAQVVAQRQSKRPGDIEKPIDMRSRVDNARENTVKAFERPYQQPAKEVPTARAKDNKPEAKLESVVVNNTGQAEKVNTPKGNSVTDTKSKVQTNSEKSTQSEKPIEDELQEELVKTAKDEVSVQVPGALFLIPEINQELSITTGNLDSAIQIELLDQVSTIEGTTSKATEGQNLVPSENFETLLTEALGKASSTEVPLTVLPTESAAGLEKPVATVATATTVETAATGATALETPKMTLVEINRALEAQVAKLLENQSVSKPQQQFAQMLEAYGVTEVQVNRSVVTETANAVKLIDGAAVEGALDESLKVGGEGVTLVASSQETSTDSGRGNQTQDEKDAKHLASGIKSTLNGPVESAERFQGLMQIDKSDSILSTKEVIKTPVSPAAILDQIKEAMVKQPLKVGEHSEMIIKLKPEELGKVELKIEVHKDSVIAKFEVASQMVKEAIESNLSDLKNSLKDKGFGDMSFDVNVAKEKSNGHQQGSGHSKRGRRSPGGIAQLEKIETQYQKSLVSLIGNSQFEHYA